MDCSSRRAKKTNLAGLYFSKWWATFFRGQSGCHGNDLFNGLTCNDAQYVCGGTRSVLWAALGLRIHFMPNNTTLGVSPRDPLCSFKGLFLSLQRHPGPFYKRGRDSLSGYKNVYSFQFLKSWNVTIKKSLTGGKNGSRSGLSLSGQMGPKQRGSQEHHVK